MKEILSTVFLRALPGKMSELKRVLEAIAPVCRKEEGCLQYDFFETLHKTDTILLFMRWKNPQARDRHETTPHVQEFIQRYENVLYKRLSRTEWLSAS